MRQQTQGTLRQARKTVAKDPSNEQWRFYLAEQFQSNQTSTASCNVDQAVQKQKILTSKEKRSASNSIILFGRVRTDKQNVNSQVVGKVYFSSVQPEIDNSLLVETTVYQDIVRHLLRLHVTPNLMLYVGHAKYDLWRCADAAAESTLGQLEKQAVQSIQARFPNKYDFRSMHVLLTERASGDTLYDTITKGTMSWQDWQTILFQLIYTIQCFIEIGFMHNDLHAGNIFVTPIRETTMLYFVRFGNQQTRCFHLKCRYLVRVYDYDFATFNKTGSPFLQRYLHLKAKNTKVRPQSTLCVAKGICDKTNDYTDLFRVFTSLTRATNPPQLREWASRFADLDFIADVTEQFSKKGVPCRSTEKRCSQVDKKCEVVRCSAVVPSIQQLKRPIAILNKGFPAFDKGVVTPSSALTTKELIHSAQPHVYATPKSRKTFPPAAETARQQLPLSGLKEVTFELLKK